jgi:hypothetical protein
MPTAVAIGTDQITLHHFSLDRRPAVPIYDTSIDLEPLSVAVTMMEVKDIMGTHDSTVFTWLIILQPYQ